jgi:Formin Homology 2 Domain
VTKILEACQALSKDTAVQFHRLLQLILLFGNYMNSAGAKGGAFGFRIASINKVSDAVLCRTVWGRGGGRAEIVIDTSCAAGRHQGGRQQDDAPAFSREDGFFQISRNGSVS